MVSLTFTPISEITSVHARLTATFDSGLTYPLEWREHQLLQVARMMQENGEAFAKALHDDLGRPALEAYQTEVCPLLERALISVERLRSWTEPEDKTPVVPDWQKGMSVKVFKEPKGTVLNIAPWNYPLILTIQPLLAAIASGCCCVLKPSEISAKVAVIIGELVPKYLDTNAYAVVQGAVEETTKLLELKWDHISYTGNGNVAKIISVAAAKHLTPLTLELGGKSPVIIDPEYPDFDVAAKRVLWGKCCNAGQICVAPDYVILPSKDALAPLVASLKKAYASFFPTTPSSDPHSSPLTSPSYSRIVSLPHFTRLTKILAETKGEIVLGGSSDKEALKIEPTVVVLDATITDVQSDSLLNGEIFGPILPVLVLDGGMQEVIKTINRRDHPLVLYTFTENPDVKALIQKRTQSGNLVFNDTFFQLAVNDLPFGGVGASGYGRQVLKPAFDGFTYERSSIDMPIAAEPALAARYPPYSAEALSMVASSTKIDIPESTPEGGAVRA